MQNKVPYFTDQSKQTYTVPSRRDFTYQIHAIDKISTEINTLLQIVKDKRQIRYNNKEKDGLYDYKKRIQVHQNLIAKQQKAMREISKNTIQSKYKLIQNKKQLSHSFIYYEIKQNCFEQLDSVPFSKPTQILNQIQSSEKRRKRSPHFISRPNSKYIRKVNPFNIQKYQHFKQQKKIVLGSHISQVQQQNSKQTSKSQNVLIQNNQFENNSIEQDFHPYRNYSQIQLGHEITPINKFIQKTDEHFIEQKTLLFNQEIDQTHKQVSDQIKDLTVRQRFQSQIINQQSSSPYHSVNFQLKVFPCNLDRDTVKSYVANRFSDVIKIDAEIIQLKKFFNEDCFLENLTILEKTKIFCHTFSERGFIIQEENFSLNSFFQASKQNAILSQQLKKKLLIFRNFCEYFADKYLQAEYEWQTKVLKMLSHYEIEETNFKAQKIDLQRKGYLKLQDITCFVNLFAQNAPCFKNKTVNQLYLRLCRGQQSDSILSYESFIQKICKNN